ncbi:hypothetical protein MTO96_040982, partial [Rhipicephalus appendiculatus]
FVCTNERVWTYSTSTSEYVRCKVDQVTSICRAAILFRRYYFYDETHHWTVKKLQGIFSTEQRDVMQVRNLGGVFLSKEKMLYMSRKYGCAVIKVTQAQLGRVFIAKEKMLYMSKRYRCAVMKVSQEQFGICKKMDIKKFVCTRDLIWTYNTSSTDYVMCKCDHMKSYRNMTMFFTRSFFVDERWRRSIQNLEGRFSKQRKEVMQVSNK